MKKLFLFFHVIRAPGRRRPCVSRRGVYCAVLLSVLSCGRTANIPKHLDDDFLHGTSEGLYRIQDLTMILDEEKIQNLSSSDKHSNYQALLSQKQRLYADSPLKPNISSLRDLLRIRTASKGVQVKISSGMENTFIDPNISFLNEYELLDYTIMKPKTPQQEILKKLLGKIRGFKGFPDTDYYIFPHFAGNYLILYKLAPADKTPYDELPLAKRVGGMLAVPLAGYHVEYCEAVKFLDPNLRETLKSRPLCKGVKYSDRAAYIRLWIHSKQVFQYLKKMDFFQRDFFQGRWIHYQTLVRSPDFINYHIENPGVKTAHLVEFRPAPDKMDVVEVYNLKKDDEARLLFIPVQWMDYEIAGDTEHLDKSFSERVKKDTHAIHRPYLELQFDRLINNEFAYQEKGGKSIKSVVITKDYISFDVEITTKGRVAYMTKYSFERYVENPDYIEKRWFKKDNMLFFPMHSVQRKYYEDPADHSLTDANRFQRVVRFNPKSERILWHFSKSTSKLKWIRDLGRRAVDLVNKALEEAAKGSQHKITLVLDSTGADKEAGDIRYNILNMILSEGETPEQFRWGRNIVNPVTGEVISAASNVWVNHILKDYISIVRNYIRFQIYPPAWRMKPFSRQTADFIENMNIRNLQCNDLSHPPLGVTAFMHEKINSLCPEVSRFIQKEKKDKKTFHPKRLSLPDKDIVKSCASRLAKVKILQSVVRGILHGLGMGNMLSASYDRENFYKTDEMEKLFGSSDFEMKTESHPDPPQYSSVTDIMHFEYPVLPVPGKFDIAALRFIYFDKVEKADGGFLHVPSPAGKDPDSSQKSILEAAAGENLKRYKVCGWDKNPAFCEKNDYGADPFEITANNICQANNLMMIERYRYDRKKIPEGAALPVIKYDSVINFIDKWHDKWKEYRDNILAGRGKSIDDYSFLSLNHVREYNQIMQTAANHPDIKPYYEMRKIIFDHFKRMIFVPAKHCIYKEAESRGNPVYTAAALEVIEEKILRQYPENSEKEDAVFMSCESSIVKDWAGKDKQLIAEVGFFGKDRRYLIRPNKKTDPLDEKSVFYMFHNIFFNKFLGVLHEPDLGYEYYKEWMAYINEGIDLNPYIERERINPALASKDLQLPRVLSYKTDAMELQTADPRKKQQQPSLNIWSIRMEGMKKHKAALRAHLNAGNAELLPNIFSYRALSSTDIDEYAESVQARAGLHDAEIPFLIQAYKEYQTALLQWEQVKSEIRSLPPQEQRAALSLHNTPPYSSFSSFIKQHPAILDQLHNSNFLLPFVDDPSNIMAVLFRKHNKFLKCIREYENSGENCEEAENKRAFTEFMLNHYGCENKNKEEEKKCRAKKEEDHSMPKIPI